MSSLEDSRLDVREVFLSIGLDVKTVEKALVNAKFRDNLLEVILEAELHEGCKISTGLLLHLVARKYPKNALCHRPTLLQYIATGKVTSVPQVEAAFGFFALVGPEFYDREKFEESCGIGVEVSRDQVTAAVKMVFDKCKTLILEQRKQVNVGVLLNHVWVAHPWADGKVLKKEIDIQLKQLLEEDAKKKQVQRKRMKLVA
ncbi:hypothetical protein MPTK1_3g22010 [Marchantia polymorpha subsp. ruderalis]|uniref:Glutaminyl-tRNA synthetase class Ib non-specific RNA-binding domain-containing protein n=2 Tax=Marchantia polymorpha TaxID=3197 RepID=A0AAF6B3F5_MARPO|nr:hypothetical protein MARPO_0089s0016 [Marchantia polymorpha]PTQ33381.1 hypothetical protein MARPO_0089s0016 [Marchantia polymorpha]BBN06538.1 hypothetical protein Mp_3g22010 [Marchantia polymorpha subsp. ruderalis]BBN06539.1 hypothetical protein Mp_3g22010 [Marchantia polymorpha subsp. ruderalis]|eukprot:PTQ33380.1 hypothetical protein MARPO_0089s0016 [Marchantia polymorpha]